MFVITAAWLAKNRTMTGRQYQRCIDAIGLSQLGAGRFLDVSKNTAQRYAAGETVIPVSTALLLRALVESGVKIDA